MCAPATPTKIELLDRGVVPMVVGGAGEGEGGACQWVVASSECACGTRGRAPCKCEALRLGRQADF